MSNLLHINSDLGARIKAARESAVMSQIEAAKRMHVSPRTLQAWEAGTAFPQLRHRQRLASFLVRYESKDAA